MPKPFRSLASILGGRDGSSVRERDASDANSVPAEGQAPVQPAAAPADERVVDLLETFVADIARLRARVAERFEERAEAVLADLAKRVLARELATSPPEIEALLAEALSELADETGVVVRVCPQDAERLSARWPVCAEAGLTPGDFAIEIDDGRYDAALQTRLEAMLASHRVAI